mmetsp:Transcript_34599/g.99614  ORF Transcript_34599/g.99614 Transcript_34599/m.99614 type:complete len:212 (+) Transcript_34599:274-909(+)
MIIQVDEVDADGRVGPLADELPDAVRCDCAAHDALDEPLGRTVGVGREAGLHILFDIRLLLRLLLWLLWWLLLGESDGGVPSHLGCLGAAVALKCVEQVVEEAACLTVEDDGHRGETVLAGRPVVLHLGLNPRLQLPLQHAGIPLIATTTSTTTTSPGPIADRLHTQRLHHPSGREEPTPVPLPRGDVLLVHSKQRPPLGGVGQIHVQLVH